MQTERYIVSLFGPDTGFYSTEYITWLWEECANREYKDCGIFVTGLIDTGRLVCGRIRGCELGETAHSISSVRNPIETPDETEFYHAFRNIVREVKEKLGNPSMTITIETIRFHYFVQP